MKIYSSFLVISIFISFSCQRKEIVHSQMNTEYTEDSVNQVLKDNEIGEILYKNNCAQCHNINSKVIGPALSHLPEMQKEWLYKWVKNSRELIESGDKKAIKIYEEYDRMLQPNFDLTDQEIDAIIEYIKLNRSYRD